VQGGFGVVEQTLTGLFDFLVGLLLQNEHRGQTDDQRKQQHRKDGQRKNFGLEAQAHGDSLF
jgi:hypothetical protein